jgi:hypothetical protein
VGREAWRPTIVGDVTDTLPAQAPSHTADLRHALRIPWFWAGVTAVTACAAAFLAHQLMAWPPHEDEALALLVGRGSLFQVVEQVTTERGGAPLHFVLAWGVVHLDLGLGALRTLSATFAVGSLPLIALLGRRLAGPMPGLVATALVACSWAFLFHGVYGRMYSLFLLLSTASLLALLDALDSGRRGRWALWAALSLLTVAAHPYGALVLAGQAAYVVAARRDRLRQAALAGGAVLVGGVPFWLTDVVLAGRFDVGVGVGGSRLDDPTAIARYLWRTAGDFSAGWWWALVPVLGLAALGLVTVRRDVRILALCLAGAPAAAFLAARLGGSTSPESRHLIFLLPVLAVLVAAGLIQIGRRAPVAAGLFTAALLVAEVGWAWHRTAPLFEWEPDRRQATRAQAEAYLASSIGPNDVVLGYDPLVLGAWERNPGVTRTVLPRADASLALDTLRTAPGPLGRGVWVFDASRRNNAHRRLEIERRSPSPPSAFSARAFGPFLVVTTRRPVTTPSRYLHLAARALLVGRSLGIGDAAVNMATVERAERSLRGYGPSARLRSADSR